ncbi:hypothetical protein HAX54_027420 [Datura stramonium]|uniref:Uncharacterized protein n=1 Tax=Datura stramonium TaxID=4076 RepID=A0ABS8V4M0_DATST|nr:hypothetical protein [Datura stramonium]
MGMVEAEVAVTMTVNVTIMTEVVISGNGRWFGHSGGENYPHKSAGRIGHTSAPSNEKHNQSTAPRGATQSHTCTMPGATCGGLLGGQHVNPRSTRKEAANPNFNS